MCTAGPEWLSYHHYLYLRPNINWDTGKLETIPPSRDNVNGSLFEMLKRTFIFLWSET